MQSLPPLREQSDLVLPNLAESAITDVAHALNQMRTHLTGLTEQEVVQRTAQFGSNTVHTYVVRWSQVLLRQFRSPLLILLAIASLVSFFVGESLNASIILGIIAMSVSLSSLNEYRAEQTAVDLHAHIEERCSAMRDGCEKSVLVSQLVPGDVVTLELGQIVPADLRLLTVDGLECNESVLTGESETAAKTSRELVAQPQELSGFTNCAFMGTVVAAGSATAVVITTGPHTHFGRLALNLGLEQPQTGFQLGLQRFSTLLISMASGLTTFVLLANIALGQPFIDAVLFSLAIAVGITPEMLPAVVTISLSHGSRQLARRKVIVKRLICIEDLGDVQVLFTDKTGTLTEGELTFEAALNAAGIQSAEALRIGLLATASGHAETLQSGHSALDRALWSSRGAEIAAETSTVSVVSTLPFDHERRRSSIIIKELDSHQLLVKGAPESVLARCEDIPPELANTLSTQFARGARVIALAYRLWQPTERLTAESESHLTFAGLLIYVDAPKAGVRDAVARLRDLSIDVKVITGDNPAVAQRVCGEIGIANDEVLTAADLDRMSDEQLAEALQHTSVFARVSPEQKQRIVHIQRSLGTDVAFLGDGVNDALALHEADVGISVDTATDVAKDAADVVLLEKDLNVLADGIVEGRRVFANTIKYVAMGSSSNFGNMFSAAAASLFLPFLPMLPSQILLNNLLYDSGQLAISSDRVDEEQLRRPSHWDISMIRRYMLFFGPISSLFDFCTFVLMLRVFDADAALFRSAWFIESLATQTLVIFIIRTRRQPFWRSRASTTLTVASLSAVGAGALLISLPTAEPLGFTALPWRVWLSVLGLLSIYLTLVELGKRFFAAETAPTRRSLTRRMRTVHGALGASMRQPVIAERTHHHQRRRARRFVRHRRR